MNIENFRSHMTAEILMGPNSARILEALLGKYPMELSPEDTVLDLGCGKGLTSLLIARETPARVCAADLWISAEENAKRFAQWGIEAQVTPVHADAAAMPFEKGQFRALVSVDAYHYFGSAPGFFEERILPFLQEGAEVWIGVPGLQERYAGRSEELLADWLGEEAYMFKSPGEWRALMGAEAHIQSLDCWELDCFQPAWEEWFASGHKYASGDLGFFESLIKPYTCFVGIHIRLK